MLNFKLTLLLIVVGFHSFSQIEDYKRITSTLCSPEFHGRGYVNKGDSIAADFIKNEFIKIGLKKRKRSFIQQFELDINTFPNKMFVQIDGKSLIPGIDFIVEPQSGGFDGGVYPKELTVDDFLSEEVLATLINDIQQQDFKYNSIIYNSVGIQQDTNQEIHSIINQIIQFVPVIEIVDTKFMWSVGRQQTKFPYIKIQKDVNISDSIYIQIDAVFEEKYSSQNVIAYLPSNKLNAKTIVVTAHYDHLGRLGKDTYFPGANDNASGIGVMLSIAKYFRNNKLNKNLLFIAFGGEEAGLIGSQYFVNHPNYSLKKIDFVLNIDIMGSGDEGITVVNAIEQGNAFHLLEQINQDKNLLGNIKKRGQTENSDHFWFSENGVPAIFVYTRGSNKNYHDIKDAYDQLVFEEVEDLVELFTSFIISF